MPTPSKDPKIIYDLGANNGDDIPYYLLRADKVVAVEANPVLADMIAKRFAGEIADGRLAVEPFVLDVHAGGGGGGERVPFYLHRQHDVLSQFPKPDRPEEFDRVELPAIAPHALVERHGAPYYIKIDVEHYDGPILTDLFANGIRPRYISAEMHSAEVFCALVAQGGYTHFKLVDGWSVASQYREVMIDRDGREVRHSFPPHSAGPFGRDIAGPWFGVDQMMDLIVYRRTGWKDLHATVDPDITAPDDIPVLPHLMGLSKRAAKQTAKRLIGPRS